MVVCLCCVSVRCCSVIVVVIVVVKWWLDYVMVSFIVVVGVFIEF